MEAAELQTAFLKQIKKQLPPNLALVDAIAEQLNLSNDSAYRRIRGEKHLTFDEIQILSAHFKISLDSFLHLQNNSLIFWGKNINRSEFDFENYLSGIVRQLEYFASADEKQMFYLNKDIPIFHHFMFPELAAFKCYFWSRYDLDYPKFNKGQFLIEDFIDIFNKTGKRISDLYLQIPSVEIWNLDCINTTIRQIDYYRETRIFKSQRDIETVYSCLEKLIDHIELQAEYGYKFSLGKPESEEKIKYSIYINEFILGDNTIAVEMGEEKMVFLNHNVINYIMTNNKDFINYTFETLKILLKKSMLISEISEKERQLFFNNLRERIHENRKAVN
jgi:plasmid maintenance system antidote protein VapI